MPLSKEMNSIWLKASSLVAQTRKNLPAMQETQVQSLGKEYLPGGGNGNPLEDSCLENPMDRGAWWATVHRGHKESDMTEWLTLSLSHSLKHKAQFSVWNTKMAYSHNEDKTLQSLPSRSPGRQIITFKLQSQDGIAEVICLSAPISLCKPAPHLSV